jgi:hypothetical protein
MVFYQSALTLVCDRDLMSIDVTNQISESGAAGIHPRLDVSRINKRPSQCPDPLQERYYPIRARDHQSRLR